VATSAGGEGLGARRGLAERLALEVLCRVACAAQQVGAALRQRALQHHRVGRQLVAGREHIQELPGHEGHHVFMVLFDAPDPVGGGIPPLLGQQEGLRQHVERPLLPLRVGEAPVLDGRRHSVRALSLYLRREAAGHAGLGVLQHFRVLVQGQSHQVQAFAGRCRQVHRPVAAGLQQSGAREGGHLPAQGSVKQRVELLSQGGG